jgi:uncharacterized protein (TIGR03066 family)
MIRLMVVRETALCLAAFSALLLTGCAPSVAGKWEGKVMAGEKPMGISMEFKPDGKFEQKVTNPGGQIITGTGTYKVEGDKLSSTIEATAITGKDGQTITGTSQGAKPVIYKIEGDKMTLDGGNGEMTMNRAKK